MLRSYPRHFVLPTILCTKRWITSNIDELDKVTHKFMDRALFVQKRATVPLGKHMNLFLIFHQV